MFGDNFMDGTRGGEEEKREMFSLMIDLCTL
jgi:hypothetical protein